MKKPQISEYQQNKYFSYYIELVDSENVIDTLTSQFERVKNLYKNLPEEKYFFKYAEGKWNLKEVLGHITDTERIFAYRSLCIARGEKQALPGFDENEYMTFSNFNEQTMESLIEQYCSVRESSLALFKSFSEEISARMGTANGNGVSARALVWMIAGHEKHHLEILKERYSIS
ncbi:Uncharacterized damage-inducible protein DinB (forms a four-helix bundle) [Pseudarcicella hirudinis]|uniref:Uncharacterized damage-inducible protein DinB (Forms a four-helix bundle) n=1 Tax=Pseudarcicella hirudinis TaxID=1079859 RepID=A0A1I5U799_9BACT|nr:DinB family protein [Pseudarcicella hirudinis]SFP91110.1 Uncharacterized damage-inducible protein DinB (forms a four-helix bundle) [Pseudarcicella hirudinis]